MNPASILRIILGCLVSGAGVLLVAISLVGGWLASSFQTIYHEFNVNVPGVSMVPDAATASSFFGPSLTAFILGVGGIYLLFRGAQVLRVVLARLEEGVAEEAVSVEDRLDELELLKRRDLITSEEYAAKRQEILQDL